MTPHEILTRFLQSKLRAKQVELAHNTAECLGATMAGPQRAAQAAMRRNNKSIVLLTSKLLCEHGTIETTQVRRNGAAVSFFRCPRCLTTVSSNDPAARPDPVVRQKR